MLIISPARWVYTTFLYYVCLYFAVNDKCIYAGCFSFEDTKYEASTSLAGAEVEIAYDPMNTEVIKVLYRDTPPDYGTQSPDRSVL